MLCICWCWQIFTQHILQTCHWRIPQHILLNSCNW